MMKPLTGQYECAHQSGIGLDYFTSRFDRLTIYANGRFLLIEQDHSRLTNAAQSLVSGQQVSTAAPETRREGNYIVQGMTISLRFDDGKQEQGQISPNGDGIQIAANHFNKVSNSTMLPPTHRMKKDMDDIAKGLKIAGTIGGMAFKAAKTVHETIQSVQAAGTSQPGNPNNPAAQGQPPMQQMPPQAGYAQPAPAATPYPQYPPNQQRPAPAAYVPPASVQPSRPPWHRQFHPRPRRYVLSILRLRRLCPKFQRNRLLLLPFPGGATSGTQRHGSTLLRPVWSASTARQALLQSVRSRTPLTTLIR